MKNKFSIRVKRSEKYMRKKLKCFLKYLIKYLRMIIYLVVFIAGVSIIVLSFFTDGNWVNVLSGVGTGLLTSLIVSAIINAENNAREKRKKEEDKRFVLNGIIESSIDVYEDRIHRINEFITLTEIFDKSVYKLYEDFTGYNQFENQLKTINYREASDDIKNRLNTLFNFDNYMIDYLVAELKQLPKQEYYLRGLLTKEECNNLISNYANDGSMSIY